MAILTKFLQLLKPEKNDYVDVEKHLSENYDKIDTKMEELSNSNDKKLDKGAVSSEYDTAKKIEDKIKGKLDASTVSEEYNTAKKIEDKIKEAKKAGDTAKIEADKKLNKGNLISTIQSGEDIFKALQNNTGIKFDENLLYLNDEGTKKKGFCYLDKLTNGIFECIQETTITVNNATYFRRFSNDELLKRLVILEKAKYDGAVFFFNYTPPRASEYNYSLDEKYKEYKLAILDVKWTPTNLQLALSSYATETANGAKCFEKNGQSYRALTIEKKKNSNNITFKAEEDPLDFFLINFVIFR